MSQISPQPDVVIVLPAILFAVTAGVAGSNQPESKKVLFTAEAGVLQRGNDGEGGFDKREGGDLILPSKNDQEPDAYTVKHKANKREKKTGKVRCLECGTTFDDRLQVPEVKPQHLVA